METEKKKFKHNVIRKHTHGYGPTLIKAFKFDDFVAAKIMCDELNEKATEFNPKFYFIVKTVEVK